MPKTAPPRRPFLDPVANDTGRIAYCGPYVLAGITGQPVSAVEGIIRERRGQAPAAQTLVKGTDADEVGAALGAFGYRMERLASFMDRPQRERPTVWSWMQKPRNAWAHYILAIHKGRTGHWILIKGVKLCDTYTRGEWVFACDGPHRGSRIMEVFEVKRDPSFALARGP